MRAAGLKRSLIEASGNGPVVVCADADLEAAAKGAVFGGFFCAGQVCCATERVLVDRRVHDDFLAAVVKEAEGWKLGDPFDDATLVGPMNNEPTARKMDAHLEDAVAKGAEVVLGGSREGGPADRPLLPADGRRRRRRRHAHQPRRDVRADRPAHHGRGDDEALAVANDSHLGLQAAVYTRSLKRAFRYLDNLQVGNVVVNDSTDYWEAHEPFGGASGTRTGWGRIGGRYTMLDMTDLKTVVLDVGGAGLGRRVRLALAPDRAAGAGPGRPTLPALGALDHRPAPSTRRRGARPRRRPRRTRAVRRPLRRRGPSLRCPGDSSSTRRREATSAEGSSGVGRG